jgi:hypothetical protein
VDSDDYPQILYAGTFSHGVWKSCDGGAHFARLDLTATNTVCQDPGEAPPEPASQ